MSEDGYVHYMKALRTYPPMPWWNVRTMDESELRSLYRYIKSLGPPGKLLPALVDPDKEPMTPYIVVAPPHAGRACTGDLDCGVGLICGTAAVRQCVPK
jgi:hypothetical protein